MVNIITRRVAKEWGGSAGLQTILPTSGEAGEFYQGDFYLSGPVVKDLIGLQVFGKRGTRNEDEVIGGRSGQDNRSITTRVTITPTADHDVMLEYGYAEQERTATAGVSAAAGSATVNRRENWSVSHVGRWDFGTSDFRFFREEGERETAGNTRKPEVVNTGLRGQFVTWFGANTLTLGGAWDQQEIDDSLGAITGNNAGQPVGGPNSAEASQYALFAEDEFAVTDDFLLTGGVRMDSHEDYGIHFSPRAYAVYHINGAFTLKGGVSTGYRTPDLRQITSGWATSTGGWGCAGANTCGVIEGNPNLKPETSITEEVSLLWSGRGGYEAGVTVFNSSFEDKIENFNTGTRNADGFFVWRNENIGKAVQRGVELTFRAPVSDAFLLDGNYTYTNSEIEEAPPGYPQLEGQPLTSTPRHAANLSLTWLPSDEYSAYVRMVYQGEQVRAVTRGGVSERPATTTFDVGGSIEVAPGASLKLAVLNVADEVVDSNAAGNWLADEGRRVWVSLNAGF